MASLGLFRSGACIQPPCWISTDTAGGTGVGCGQRLRLRGKNAIIACVFNGGSKVGYNCAGSDSYVSSSFGNLGTVCGASPYCADTQLLVNVWKAWRDSAWTSSVTIDVYGYKTTLYSPSCLSPYLAVDAESYRQTGTPCDTACITPGVAWPSRADISACPTTKLTTITLLDDGTYTYT